MKITIYELLGLIKDGKAPKKIKYEDKIYTFYDFVCGYYEEGFAGINNKKFLTFRNEQYYKVLNDEVEILDEEEFEDIKPLVLRTFERTGQAITTDRLEDYCDYNFEMIENTIAKMVLNQKKIIQSLNKLGE